MSINETGDRFVGQIQDNAKKILIILKMVLMFLYILVVLCGLQMFS